MKLTGRWIATLGVICLALCLLTGAALAQEGNRFPEGVIEIDRGTQIILDDEAGTVTIFDSPADIQPGDTFIVYFQDLPIGYTARAVEARENALVIAAEKADKAVYSLLEESGSIALTPDTYEFIPAPNVRMSRGARSAPNTGMSYDDGALNMYVSLGGATASVSLSNLYLDHSFSGGEIYVVLSGNWTISTTLEVSGDALSEIPLGEIRIAGIGKIAVKLSLTQSAGLNCAFSGSFRAGVIATQNDTGSIIKDFGLSGSEVSGKGSISASLKITAGVDILVAEADIYAEVGIRTQMTARSFTDPDSHQTTHCEDIRIYLFSNVGAEAKYFSITAGKMKTIASRNLLTLADENQSPFMVGLHFENGVEVGSCSQGMEVPELHFGGAVEISSSLSSDGRERVIETNVTLPYDVTVEQDLILKNGDLSLNGHTLTVKGSLIQENGVLSIESGTLIVEGDYRLQTQEGGDSQGILSMWDDRGKMVVGGDFIVQTASPDNALQYGEIRVGGDLIQINASDFSANFVSNSELSIVITGSGDHTIRFEAPEGNLLGNLKLEANAVIGTDIRIQNADLNGHTLTAQRNLTQIPGGMLDVHGGTLTVQETMYHHGGTLYVNSGRVNIGENYYCVGEDSSFAAGQVNINQGAGVLEMTFDADEMRVGGNFLVNSYAVHLNHLEAGTLYLAGDFTELYAENNRYFTAADAHKTVLNGDGPQTVRFEAYASSFGTLIAENDQIVFQNYVSWAILGSDLHAASEGAALYSREIDLNGHSLTIDGNIWLKSNLDVNGGRFTVNGNVYHHEGTLNVNGGKVNISGNYYNVGEDSTLASVSLHITPGYGILHMANDADEVWVGGDFLTDSACNHHDSLAAGTLYLAGNFTQMGDQSPYSFDAQPGHTTVLNGTGEQIIRFESDSSGFGVLKAENDQIVFRDHVGFSILGSDLHAVSDAAILCGRDMNLNIHRLTVDGNLYVKSNIDLDDGCLTVNGDLFHHAGVLNINGGKMDITGNYYNMGEDSGYNAADPYDLRDLTDGSGTLKMIFDADEVHVGGNFLTRSCWNHDLAAGTLYIAGNVTQASDATTDFLAHPEHTTVLNGTGKQIIYFENQESCFGTLETTNDEIEIWLFLGFHTLNSDLHAEGWPMLYGQDIALNGHSLTIDGNLYIKSNIDLDGGQLAVNGSLHHYQGTLRINGGRLEIADDYYCVGEDSSFGSTEGLTEGQGLLQMDSDADEMLVGGDFIIKSINFYYNTLEAGTLRLAGNFTQLGSIGNSFLMKVRHKTVLIGTGTQSIFFEDKGACFGTLELTQPLIAYSFDPFPCWLLLILPEDPVFGTPNMTLPSSLTEIEASAFEGIRAAVVYVPDSCASIGDFAFKDSALTQIRVPADCWLSDAAFEGCRFVQIFSAPGSPAEDYCNTHLNCMFVEE